MQPNRQYIAADISQGYPAGIDMYYECMRCSDIIPSLPDNSTYCSCRNIAIYPEDYRMNIDEITLTRFFIIISKE